MATLRKTLTTSSSLRHRWALPALAAACLLGACSSESGGDWMDVYDVAKHAWSGSGPGVKLEQAAAVPYASMGVRLGDGPEVMIILASDMGGQRLWTSAARIAITTESGRIVRTEGFTHDLGSYVPIGDAEENGARTVRWQADFPDLKLYSILILCRDKQVRDETIVILGKDIHTRRIDESCSSESSQLDWSFENTYWVDPANGFVWRSIQHVHPQLDAIETEVLRPPG